MAIPQHTTNIFYVNIIIIIYIYLPLFYANYYFYFTTDLTTLYLTKGQNVISTTQQGKLFCNVHNGPQMVFNGKELNSVNKYEYKYYNFF